MNITESELFPMNIQAMVDTPKKRNTLMCWMAENQTATPSDIIGKAMDIEKYDN